jgi:hypothetical protein
VLVKSLYAIAIITVTLLSLMTSVTSLSIAALGEKADVFGVQKIYPTAEGGREWYVNMDDPKNDFLFRNLDNIEFSPEGDSWHVSADQVRMEAWSEENEKWLNVEITAYAKIGSGSPELLQLYSRGGHHSDNNQCEGSAYKARLYGDGTAAWTKEITHPAYVGNRGEVQATETPLEDRWVGFKGVVYNFEEDGNTYVRLESYVDDDVTDSRGNLVVGNNWKLASVVEDRGGWATTNSDFDSSCPPLDKDSSDRYRQRDEILSKAGGTNTQNIVGFRTDGIDWSFKYLSAREIQPFPDDLISGPGVPTPEIPVETPEMPVDTPYLPSGFLITNSSQYQDGTATIDSVDLTIRKITTRTHGDVNVAITQGGKVLGSNTAEASDLDLEMQQITLPIIPIEISGSYEVLVLFHGAGYVSVGGIHAVAT